jgi:hypothetical protein
MMMQLNSDALFQAAIQLSEDERLSLASRILETVPEESTGLSIDDPDLVEELNRRAADMEGAVPWSQLRDEI